MCVSPNGSAPLSCSRVGSVLKEKAKGRNKVEHENGEHLVVGCRLNDRIIGATA